MFPETMVAASNGWYYCWDLHHDCTQGRQNKNCHELELGIHTEPNHVIHLNIVLHHVKNVLQTYYIKYSCQTTELSLCVHTIKHMQSNEGTYGTKSYIQ